MNTNEKAALRFAEIMDMPNKQIPGSPFLRKLVTDAESGCILIDSNKKKLFYIKNCLSFQRIKK